MANILFVLGFLSLVAFFASVMYYSYTNIPVEVHKAMTVAYCKEWGYGTFNQFLQEFDKKKWEHTSRWPEGYFDYKTNSEIHAGIVKFDGKGMVLKRSEFFKLREFLKVNRASGYRKGIWS